MGIQVNRSAVENARALISRGEYVVTPGWGREKEPERSLKNDKWFLAHDTDAKKDVQAYYKYPIGDGGKIHRAALIAAESRAGAQHETAVRDAAKALLAFLDKKVTPTEKKACDFFDFFYGQDNPDTSHVHISKDGLVTEELYLETKAVNREGLADDEVEFQMSTTQVDRKMEILNPLGGLYDNFKKNPILLWQHRDSLPPLGTVPKITPSKTGITGIAKFNNITREQKDFCKMYKAGDMTGFSPGFFPIVQKSISLEDAAEYIVDGVGYMLDKPGSRVRVHEKWELAEVSACNIPVNPGATTIRKAIEFENENIVRKAIEHGTIDADSPVLRMMGLSTRLNVKSVGSDEELDRLVLQEIQSINQKLSQLENKKMDEKLIESTYPEDGQEEMKAIVGLNDMCGKAVEMHKAIGEHHSAEMERRKAFDIEHHAMKKALHEHLGDVADAIHDHAVKKGYAVDKYDEEDGEYPDYEGNGENSGQGEEGQAANTMSDNGIGQVGATKAMNMEEAMNRVMNMMEKRLAKQKFDNAAGARTTDDLAHFRPKK